MGTENTVILSGELATEAAKLAQEVLREARWLQATSANDVSECDQEGKLESFVGKCLDLASHIETAVETIEREHKVNWEELYQLNVLLSAYLNSNYDYCLSCASAGSQELHTCFLVFAEDCEALGYATAKLVRLLRDKGMTS